MWLLRNTRTRTPQEVQVLPLPRDFVVVGGCGMEEGDVALALHLQAEAAVDRPLAQLEDPHLPVLHTT